MRHLLLAVLLALAPAAVAAPVSVDGGRIEGVEEGGVVAFKGIPYAAAPVGDLRWRPPAPVIPWPGVRKAGDYGHDCLQNPFPGDAAPLGGPMVEDCLYLNVWAPKPQAGVKRPVMVWIHGGGFVNGGSSPTVYDGSAFARSGVILVSLNYRLGRFGFFAHPALTAEAAPAPTGNFGFMDQVAALQWVRRNIAGFGGDPANVTLFGESAGGRSVHVLLSVPAAAGLFDKAIIMSGGGRATGLGLRPLGDGEQRGVNFARRAGVEDQGAKGLAALRALPAERVVDGLDMRSIMGAGVDHYAGPMLDGKFLVEEPAKSVEAGRAQRVPLMVGATGLDGFPIGDAETLLKGFGAGESAARQAYASPTPLLSVWKIVGDRIFIEPARHLARQWSGAGLPTFAYRFSHVAESQREKMPGATHASEIPYAFRTIDARYPGATSPADQAVAKAFHDHFVAFARMGNPGYPPYAAATDALMDYVAGRAQFRPDPLRDRLDLMEAIQ
ncbi:carboxylesterase/lipase family protein [Niveispirillum sp. KHB5.9]|uniref:carboxylesterase/lipase family protein n=1 Tax=Niveispirillum sp. KHB5.9 TaxID=3400269 RepID=UPI003A88D601